MKYLVLLFVLGSLPALGQDPGAMAAQQAMQQAIDANQQAIQASQQAMQASQQASQQATQDMQNAQQNSAPLVAVTRPPSFSVKAGTVTAGTTVRLKCPTHYAVIYYTTNGWTPTTSSRRYSGPIPISATTQLQAIAVAPNFVRSPIARAEYKVPGSPAELQPLALSADGVLHAGTRLHLVTGQAMSSKSVQVGDKIALQLDEDVKLGDTVLVPKGTPVDAIITQADPSGHLGTPGDIAFEVHSLTVHGTEIPLQGGEALEGANHYGSRNYMLIPVVGIIPALATRGDEAAIKPGMSFTAAVAADTPLHP
jgi:type II secretory pathway pseudopilin PulG